MKRRPFIFIGGSPALDLLNTQPMGDEGLDERLIDAAALADWLVKARLLSAAKIRSFERRKSDQKTVEEIRMMRESLRRALRAQSEGRAQWGSLLRDINIRLCAMKGAQSLERKPDGTFETRYAPAVERFADVTGLVAFEIARFAASEQLEHARRCLSRDCVLWFADSTKNHSRRWCRMETCGARHKAKAYYERKKTLSGAV